jgi:hypothetical protein
MLGGGRFRFREYEERNLAGYPHLSAGRIGSGRASVVTGPDIIDVECHGSVGGAHGPCGRRHAPVTDLLQDRFPFGRQAFWPAELAGAADLAEESPPQLGQPDQLGGPRPVGSMTIWSTRLCSAAASSKNKSSAVRTARTAYRRSSGTPPPNSVARRSVRNRYKARSPLVSSAIGNAGSPGPAGGPSLPRV